MPQAGQRGAGFVRCLTARRDGVEDRNGLRVGELDDIEHGIQRVNVEIGRPAGDDDDVGGSRRGERARLRRAARCL